MCLGEKHDDYTTCMLTLGFIIDGFMRVQYEESEKRVSGQVLKGIEGHASMQNASL